MKDIIPHNKERNKRNNETKLENTGGISSSKLHWRGVPKRTKSPLFFHPPPPPPPPLPPPIFSSPSSSSSPPSSSPGKSGISNTERILDPKTNANAPRISIQHVDFVAKGEACLSKRSNGLSPSSPEEEFWNLRSGLRKFDKNFPTIDGKQSSLSPEEGLGSSFAQILKLNTPPSEPKNLLELALCVSDKSKHIRKNSYSHSHSPITIVPEDSKSTCFICKELLLAVLKSERIITLCCGDAVHLECFIAYFKKELVSNVDSRTGILQKSMIMSKDCNGDKCRGQHKAEIDRRQYHEALRTGQPQLTPLRPAPAQPKLRSISSDPYDSLKTADKTSHLKLPERNARRKSLPESDNFKALRSTLNEQTTQLVQKTSTNARENKVDHERVLPPLSSNKEYIVTAKNSEAKSGYSQIGVQTVLKESTKRRENDEAMRLPKQNSLVKSEGKGKVERECEHDGEVVGDGDGDDDDDGEVEDEREREGSGDVIKINGKYGDESIVKEDEDDINDLLVQFMVSNCSHIKVSKLIQFGNLRVADRLQVLFNDEVKYELKYSFLFEKYLAIWDVSSEPVLIDMSHAEVTILAQSLKIVCSTQLLNKKLFTVSLRSSAASVFEKWIIMLMDKTLELPKKKITSTIELKNLIKSNEMVFKFGNQEGNKQIGLRKALIANSKHKRNSYTNETMLSKQLEESCIENRRSSKPVSFERSETYDLDVDSDEELINSALRQN